MVNYTSHSRNAIHYLWKLTIDLPFVRFKLNSNHFQIMVEDATLSFTTLV